jgi:A/G-specific adenine glycosylase
MNTLQKESNQNKMGSKIDFLFRTTLCNWYTTHRRTLPWRQTKDPYAIWVSEVMLQQTQVNTVIPYYTAFLKYFPTVKTLAASDLQDVLKVWEGLGYYARARNLYRAANKVAQQYDGAVPDDWKRFRALSGVGDYIAAAVLSMAFNQPYAVVDGNVKRVLARLFTMPQMINKSTYQTLFQTKADELIDTGQPGIFNQAMMELGAIICTPRHPDCTHCPLSFSCKAFTLEKVSCYPKREKKKKRPLYHIAIGVVRKNDCVLITRRKPDGLLGGLWEFPGGKINSEESSVEALKRELTEETSLTVNNLTFLTRIKHAYTHFKIEADVLLCDYAHGKVRLNGPVDYRWIVLSEIDNYPFPKANHKFIPLLRQHLEGEKR